MIQTTSCQRSATSKVAARPYSPWAYSIAALYFTLYGLVKYVPSPIGDVLRWLTLKPFVMKIGTMRVKEGLTIWFPEGVSIGRNVSINEWVFLDGYGGIEIGDCCRIAHGCSLVSEDHGFDLVDTPIYEQPKIPGKIVLGRDVWLGAGTRVLRGVTIGQGCVIGAGAVVTQDVPAYSVAVGNPARVIKRRGQHAKSECAGIVLNTCVKGPVTYLQRQMKKLKEDKPSSLVKTAFRFGMFSGLSFTISVGLTIFLHEVLGYADEIAYAVALLTAFTVNFLACRYVIFEAAEGDLRRQLFLFALSGGSFRGLEYVSYLLIHTLLGVPYVIAICTIQLISFVTKFFFFRTTVFGVRAVNYGNRTSYYEAYFQ